MYYPGESIGYEFITSQSELFRFIPISVSEPMRIIPNQSEKSFVSRLMKNGKKSIRPNPILIRGNNPNESKPIRKRIFHPNEFEVGMIRIENSVLINSRSDWSDWKLGFGLVWIHSNCCLGLSRIRSDQSFTIFHQTSYKTFVRLVRNDSHWLWYRYRNESE